MQEFLHSTYIAGNEVWRILAFTGVVLLAFLGGKLVQILSGRFAERQRARNNPIIGALLNAFSRSSTLIVACLGLKIASILLVLTEKIDLVVNGISSSLVAVAVGYALFLAVDAVDLWLRSLSERTKSKMDDMLVPMVRKSLRVTVVVFTLLQIATILSDKPLTSILAGLGIGGLAVALASQDTLKNLFGSLVLFGDKPFELGDRIAVDDFDGPIEEVGFRSTRIRTLEGHLVTIPNGELANKSIRNIGKRPHIRRVMNLGVTYDTPPDKLTEGIEIVKSILKDHKGQDSEFPPRVFFSEFNNSSLNIFAIYWFHPPDYWDYMEESQRINLEILKQFNDAGIEFAFPTQTLFLAGDQSRPLAINE